MINGIPGRELSNAGSRMRKTEVTDGTFNAMYYLLFHFI